MNSRSQLTKMQQLAEAWLQQLDQNWRQPASFIPPQAAAMGNVWPLMGGIPTINSATTNAPQSAMVPPYDVTTAFHTWTQALMAAHQHSATVLAELARQRQAHAPSATTPPVAEPSSGTAGVAQPIATSDTDST